MKEAKDPLNNKPYLEFYAYNGCGEESFPWELVKESGYIDFRLYEATEAELEVIYNDL